MQIAWRHASTERNAMRDLVTLLGVDPAARFHRPGRRQRGPPLRIHAGDRGPDRLPLLARPSCPLAAAGRGRRCCSRPAWPSWQLWPPTSPSVSAPGRAWLRCWWRRWPCRLLIGAAQATDSLLRSGGILPWLLMLVLADLLLAIVGVLTARPLEEAAT